jgi:hypothetical protein
MHAPGSPGLGQLPRGLNEYGCRAIELAEECSRLALTCSAQRLPGRTTKLHVREPLTMLGARSWPNSGYMGRAAFARRTTDQALVNARSCRSVGVSRPRIS